MDPAHPLPARDSHAKQPPRSILKSSGARRDAHAQSGSSSPPQVQFKDPPPPPKPRLYSKSSLRHQKPIENVGQIPNNGPVPPVTLPATASRDELEIMAFQLAAHLRELRIAEEEARRKQDAQRLPRPTGCPDDFPEFKKILMGPWVAGSVYGPVFEPTIIVRARNSVKVNPVLDVASHHLVWDMKSSFEKAKCFSARGEIALDSILGQPATSPRLSDLCIVSQSFSWALRVSAEEQSIGITVGDILHFLDEFFSVPLGDRDLREATSSHRAAMIAAHSERISRSSGPSRICVYDWLLGKTTFDGIAHDPNHTRADFLGRRGEVYIVLSLKDS
ncbi:hypothetical protein BDZ89DRAFT_1077970 [Hymenopellis radicata]|nr:hypothetical protein BDZ89DRAFT_1077970 [Hymenopellis radicata]